MKYIKTYENWFSNYFKEPEIEPQTQEELDKQLYDAIVNVTDFFSAADALNKGANPNQVQDEGRGYEYSLLMIASTNGDMKLIEKLIEHGADVYFRAYQWEYDRDVKDYFDFVNNVCFFEYRPKIKKIILKYHPDFMEERELRKDTKKYNL